MRLYHLIKWLLWGIPIPAGAEGRLIERACAGASDLDDEGLIKIIGEVRKLLMSPDLVITKPQEGLWTECVRSGRVAFGRSRRTPQLQISIPSMGFYLDYWCDGSEHQRDYVDMAIRLPFKLRRRNVHEVLMQFCLGHTHRYVQFVGDEPYQSSNIWVPNAVLVGHMRGLYGDATRIVRRAEGCGVIPKV